jgi:hypothetical protein
VMNYDATIESVGWKILIAYTEQHTYKRVYLTGTQFTLLGLLKNSNNL